MRRRRYPNVTGIKSFIYFSPMVYGADLSHIAHPVCLGVLLVGE